VKNAIRGAQTLAAVVGADEEATRAIAVATKKSALADKATGPEEATTSGGGEREGEPTRRQGGEAMNLRES